MARIRTVKPEFWSHPVMSQQSDATKLLAISLLNFADDHGYFYATPALVRSQCRPLDDDSTMIRRCLSELSCIGYVSIVEHPTHGMLGHVVSFASHQKVDRPKDSVIKELFHSTNVRRLIVDESPQEGKGKEGKVVERKKTSCRPPSGDQQLIIGWWKYAFKQVEGREYIIQGKDVKHVKGMLATLPFKEIIRRGCSLLISSDPFLQEKKDLPMLASQINRIRPIGSESLEECRQYEIIPPEGVNFEDWKFWEGTDEA